MKLSGPLGRTGGLLPAVKVADVLDSGLLSADKPRRRQRAERLSLALLLVLHVVATCVLLPPWEIVGRQPLLHADHPVHTHRVYMYRQALFDGQWPWGYDPAIAAGLVVHPSQDVGAKPQQLLGVLLPFLSPATVVRLFLFMAALTFPLWTLLACRRLQVSLGAQVWTMVVLLVPAWLFGNLPQYFLWGLVSFTSASYFLPYALVLFLSFLTQPCRRSYVAFCFAAALLLLLHVEGPVAILPPLVLYTLTACTLSWRWRVATLLVPLIVVVLNAFWFVPFVLARGMPRPLLPLLPALVTEPHMTYTSWSQVMEAVMGFRGAVALGGVALAIYGFVMLRKVQDGRVVASLALAAGFALFLKFFGSFLPIVVDLQPARFLVPGFALLTIPVGVALHALCTKIRLPSHVVATGVLFLIVPVALVSDKPQSLPRPADPDPLSEFVARRTTPEDRLLIQSDQYEAKVFALSLQREVIGSTFPVESDPSQFLPRTLWGKALSAWSPQELRFVLERWGITWAFTRTAEAGALLAKVTNREGEVVGKYRAFQVSLVPNRFLVGKGRVVANVNCLELTELSPANGLIVLRYRYHPAWQSEAGLPVFRYPVPEDPSGFIALKHPPETITLHFNPWTMLRAPWPHDSMID